MQRNGRTAGSVTYPAENIETVRIDPEAIVDAHQINHERQHASSSRVIRISPPFDTEVEGKPFTAESGNSYPLEMSPKPIHIQPSAFLEETGTNLIEFPTHQKERELLQEEPNVSLTEKNVEEWYQQQLEVWKEDVRAAIKDSISVDLEGSSTLDADLTIDD
ncbi:hypothetical protein [Salinilacihabitans rarus]|uniref:hypothetical protein n=1 Tax=Salinilacihabitans rarus TaxID=2961596 RepID=UPI0020C8AEE0|nr:hypothetical protein [Salinilacihabitans rarus]